MLPKAALQRRDPRPAAVLEDVHGDAPLLGRGADALRH
jgi:hypothetical protein